MPPERIDRWRARMHARKHTHTLTAVSSWRKSVLSHNNFLVPPGGIQGKKTDVTYTKDIDKD